MLHDKRILLDASSQISALQTVTFNHMNAPQVTVFHFTSRISNAKIRKYKLATERGMAPGTTAGSAAVLHRNNRSESAQTNGSPASTDSNLVDAPRQTKKPRLKINVGPKTPKVPSDTIAQTRPRRENVSRPRYSQELDAEKKKSVSGAVVPASPAASSGLSSLSSAPPSGVDSESREESPFIDPEPSDSRADYGDFMSYYIAGGDAEDQNVPKKHTADSEEAAAKRKRQSTAKAATQTNASPSTESSRPTKRAKKETPTPKVLTPAESHAQSQRRALNAIQPNGPTGQARRPSQPAQPMQPVPRPMNVPPPYPQGPPAGMQMHPQHMPPQPPPAIPQPIIQFVDIVHEPRPTQPDTIAVMIRKLQDLSTALTNFGGVPAVPATPPPERPKVRVKAKPQPAAPSDPLDGFLSLFGDEGEEGDQSEEVEEEFNFNVVLPDLGTADGSLSYGIQFIQNALKSWAQQRITHQITQQLQSSHQQALLLEQQMAQRRGPGRPKKFPEVPLPGQPGGPPPVIQTNLTDTPEGVAIKAFQSVLDSACLRANVVLPVELSRALRHLYMQIDHLINQGAKEDRGSWYCMSYGAQIAAHKARVAKWKEMQAKAQEEMARQQAMAQQLTMQQMGVDTRTVNVTNDQARHAHEMELERKRSMQHAQQQPYNSQQHLNPLHFGPQPPAVPIAAGPSPSPVASNDASGRPLAPMPPNHNPMHATESIPHSGPSHSPTIGQGNAHGMSQCSRKM